MCVVARAKFGEFIVVRNDKDKKYTVNQKKLYHFYS